MRKNAATLFVLVILLLFTLLVLFLPDSDTGSSAYTTPVEQNSTSPANAEFI